MGVYAEYIGGGGDLEGPRPDGLLVIRAGGGGVRGLHRGGYSSWDLVVCSTRVFVSCKALYCSVPGISYVARRTVSTFSVIACVLRVDAIQ